MLKFVVFCVFFGFVVCEVVDLPSNFPTCSRDLPRKDMEKCVIEATETLRPLLARGIRKLGFFPLEPSFKLPEIDLGSTSEGFEAKIKNLEIFDLINYKFKSLDFDFESHITKAVFEIPTLFLKGILEFKGVVLNLPLETSGKFFFNVTTPTNCKVTIKSKVEVENGVEFLHHYDYELKLRVGDIKNVKFSGSFGDNEAIANAAKQIINENANSLVDFLNPSITKVLTDLVKNVYFQKLNHVPYNVLFPRKK